MTPELQRRLAEFVDRRSEMTRFSEMLEGNGKRFFAIWGDGGLGKSSLLARMIHEAAQRKLRRAEVTWTNTRNYDYLGVMRKVRDDLGVEAFNPFTDLVNYYTVDHYTLKIDVSGTINVASGLKVENSHVGDIAGVIIKDAMFVSSRSDQRISETERMIQLTGRFIECLVKISRAEPVLLFFDTTEKMTPQTRDWVWGELFAAMHDGRLPGVYAVWCGQDQPALERDMAPYVEAAELRPLEVEDIAEYLERRGVEPHSRQAIAEVLYVTTAGKPLQLATTVDAVLQRFKRAK